MDVKQPKYGLGQTLFTVGLLDLKIKEVEVEKIVINIKDGEQTIDYWGKGLYTSYAEDKCFTSREDLLRHIES